MQETEQENAKQRQLRRAKSAIVNIGTFQSSVLRYTKDLLTMRTLVAKEQFKLIDAMDQLTELDPSVNWRGNFGHFLENSEQPEVKCRTT